MDFKEKIVIVTGAGSGIGRGIAKAYAREGAQVIIAEKNPNSGKSTEREIKTSRGNALFIQTDVSIPEQITALVRQVVETYGRIDILINNVGVSKWASPYELTVEAWDAILNTNLRSVFLCARETAKYMRQQGGGSIVNIASTRAIMSEPDSEAYAASKGGIVALTHALAASLARDSIRVNCISPGWIETIDYAKLRDIDHQQHFSQRVGHPDDVARACLFLSAPGNEFINGTNIIIDGGMTHKMIYEP
jgi:NAD(P)-dependent dehydrogenase (short-subunit alcohol dehydrogenase family)